MSKSQALDVIGRLLKDVQEVDFRVEGDLNILLHPISTESEQTTIGERPEQSGVYIQFITGNVWVDGKMTETLTRNEYDLLSLLYTHKGAIVSKQEIWQVVWPERSELDNAALEKLVSRLRVKIESDPNNPQHLLTIRGRGYRLAIG
jgi:DNA-binding response OmpR family regulator